MNNDSDSIKRVNLISVLINQNCCTDYFEKKVPMPRLEVNGNH